MAKHKSGGFTLLEVMIVVAIIAILAEVAYPSYAQYLARSRAVELDYRIDAMRTAFAAARAEGTLSLEGRSNRGDTSTGVGNSFIRDSLTHPELIMDIVATSTQIGQFNSGVKRPYLMLVSKSEEGARLLQHVADSLPESVWAWYGSSTMLMISLLEMDPVGSVDPSNPQTIDQQPGAPSGGQDVAVTTPVNGGMSAEPIVASGSVTGTPAVTASTNENTDQKAVTLAPGPASLPTQMAAPQHIQEVIHSPTPSGCTHPGNGHAYGYCSHHQ